MTPRVWLAGSDDAEAIARLLVAFRDHQGRDWPSANAFLASVERLLERHEAEFLLAADGDGPAAGVAQLRYRFGVWYAALDCALEDLYVLPEARRQGLARALVERALERAQERGCRRVELDVGEENRVARSLYESLGFRTGTGGPGRDLLMRCHLRDQA